MSSGLLATANLPDSITFVIAAVIVIAGALGVVLMKNPVHSALMLVMTLFGIAVLFVEQDAQFLAAVQVIVYTGAVVVLFLFVIMLLGVDRREVVFADTFKGQRLFALVVGACVLAEVIFLGSRTWTTGAPSVVGAVTNQGANVNVIGRSIFTTYLLPFEVTSALLVVAVIAAVVLGRRHSESVEEANEVAKNGPLSGIEPDDDLSRGWDESTGFLDDSEIGYADVTSEEAIQEQPR